jgi:hypothetical protein
MKKYSLLFCLLLQACATYSTRFNCSPARGEFCTPLHKVDELITSGEIEKLDLDLKKQKLCKICR